MLRAYLPYRGRTARIMLCAPGKTCAAATPPLLCAAATTFIAVRRAAVLSLPATADRHTCLSHRLLFYTVTCACCLVFSLWALLLAFSIALPTPRTARLTLRPGATSPSSRLTLQLYLHVPHLPFCVVALSLRCRAIAARSAMPTCCAPAAVALALVERRCNAACITSTSAPVALRAI